MTTPMSDERLSDERLSNLLERLAAIEHERWAGWMAYQAEHCNLIGIEGQDIHKSGEPFAERWARQAATPYAQLTEAEKESDRIEARKGLALYLAEIDRLRTRNAELEAVLREVEWSGPVIEDDDGIGSPSCPWCGWVRRMVHHSRICELDAALREED